MDRYWSTKKQEWIYPNWKVAHIDLGPNVDGFWQWWEVTNGERSYKSTSEEDAEWLCAVLNGDEPE